MPRALRHLRRLHVIARTLARHNAIVGLDRGGGPIASLFRGYGRWVRRGRAAPGRAGERLAAACNDLGPTFVKFGQALSVRPDVVGAELADDLSRLRDRLPPFAAAAARAAIAAEFGRPVEELFSEFDDQPLAAASIAQVHRAVTAAGAAVAVKVLRPDIEAAFRRDLELLAWLAEWTESLWPKLRRLRPAKVVETIGATVAQELDLRQEAAAAAEFAGNFAGDADFRVPQVDWQRTGRRVLTMARVQGPAIDAREKLRGAGHDPRAIAAQVIRVFLKQALRDGFFHADLHQGNLFVAPDGALEAVDFGIVGRLDKATRRFMAEILLSFLAGDYRRAAEIHFAAGYVPPSQSIDSFAQALRSIGEPILGRPVNEISIGRLLAQLFHVTERFAMATQPQLLLLQKTMVTVEGVARSLDPDVNFWTVAKPVIEGWMSDNLGPEARLREVSDALTDLLQRLPAFATKLELAANAITESGVRFDADSMRHLAQEQARARRPPLTVYLLVALILGILALYLLR